LLTNSRSGLPAIINLIIGIGILYEALIVLSNVSAKNWELLSLYLNGMQTKKKIKINI